MKKIIIFALTMFISCTVFAQNEQLASKASIEVLLELTEAKQTYDATMKDMAEMVTQSSERFLDQIPSQNQTKFKKAMTLFNAMFQEEMSWDKIKSHYLQIYAETFTQQEINDLIAFYKTPSGKAFIKKDPIVNQKISLLYKKKSMEIMDHFAKIVEESVNN